MAQMGFITSPKKEVEKITKVKENSVFRFDSGYPLSLADLQLHTIIFGSTGAGKTHSLFLPILSGQISSGKGGVIIDIKGNLREQVRSLAKNANREQTVYEYGLSDTAISLNILANMNTNETQELFEAMVKNSISDSTNNMDFHIRGIIMCVQLVQLLKLTYKKQRLMLPTLEDVYYYIINPHKAAELYSHYKNNLFDKNNKAEVELLSAIDADAFHIVHYEATTSKSRTYLEQMNYAINGPRTALSELISVKKFGDKFANPNGVGLDYNYHFQNNHIVILRFDPGTGKVASLFSRYFVTKYYETVFDLGIDVAAKHPSFICIDEFHEVATLKSSDKYSDTAFVAQAREFNASFMASTQSASSLMGNENDEYSVNSFISNCNVKLSLRSDDPLTQKVMANYDREVELLRLDHGKVFAAIYSNSEKKLHVSYETIQNEYEKTQNIIKDKANSTNRETIIEKNEILLSLLQRNEYRNMLNPQEEKILAREIDIENVPICKIFNDDDPDECKIRARAFLGKYLNFFENIEPLETYIPLSWQKPLKMAFRNFARTKMPISIKDIEYDAKNNLPVIVVYDELEEGKEQEAQKAQVKINRCIASAFKELRKVKQPILLTN